MASLLPHLEVTRAVGVHGANIKPFNDLETVGGWPLSQNIERISKIEVFAGGIQVIGLRITYVLYSGRTQVVTHGKDFGDPSTVELDEKNLLVGTFGGLLDGSGIESIGFVSFNTETATVQIKGPFGSNTEGRKAYGTFGNTIAFIGTENDDYGLRSLGFVKAAGPSPAMLSN